LIGIVFDDQYDCLGEVRITQLIGGNHKLADRQILTREKMRRSYTRQCRKEQTRR
jgi:hypothetical protein